MLPVDAARFETLLLFDDGYRLVAPRTWGFASGVTSLQELDGVPMIGRRSCRCWDFVVSQFRAAGVEPNDVFRADDAFSVIGHVRSGVGVAVVSQLTVDMVRADDLDVAPLCDLMTPRRLALVWSSRRELAPVQEQFLAVTREYVRERTRAEATPPGISVPNA
jgi:DNA-binding transcriptional LysR family regulator